MLKFCRRSLLTNVCKRCVGFLLFCLELELFANIKKRLGLYTLTETRFINNLRFKQNKKYPTHPFVDIDKTKTCANFQQKILNYTTVITRQGFQFFRQITWFLGNKRGLLKFKYCLLHHLISIIKLQNNYSVKPNFMLITQATLIKNLLMLIILLWPKKLRSILKLLNLKLMIESELQSIKIFLVKVILKIGPEK